MSRLLVELAAVAALISAAASADNVWVEPLGSQASAAPQIPPGPQPFTPNPHLGVPPLPGPALVPLPAPVAVTIMDMTTGQMRICQQFGAVIACH